jgi:hypothetical protein
MFESAIMIEPASKPWVKPLIVVVVVAALVIGGILFHQHGGWAPIFSLFK